MQSQQHRCKHCNKLLAKSQNLRGAIEIKCPRCKCHYLNASEYPYNKEKNGCHKQTTHSR